MRIVSVRIRNLNSITGDWSIRLDGPEYESGGIFAITGPTGAGKSTILDAICLALYGSTPRLDKVTKSSNEIMSRQAADCMAEVRFRTMHGEYLCSWSQNKARGSGNLQQPRHRLYDKEGRALAEKTTDVTALVEKLTGMDFARFTQSMLLAQGRFATFLLADGDRRAPLLEKITGTGIYSEISRRVHERSRDEEKVLSTLDSELAAQDLLSVEEEENLARERQELQARSAELGQREQSLTEDMACIEQAEALEREAAALASEREALQLDEERFRPQAERLERATRASSLSPALEALRIRREEQRHDEEKRVALSEELPRLEACEIAERNALAEARTALEAEKESVEKARDLWKRVRAADTELDARRRDLAALDLELETRRTALERREKEQAATEQAQKKAEETLTLLTRSREASAADAALSEAVGAMETRLSLLREDEKSLSEAQAALKEHGQLLEEQETALAGRRRSADALSGALRDAAAKLEEARKNFAALLNGRDVPSCRALRDTLSARLAALDKALEAARARAVHLARAEELTAEGQKLTLTIQKEEAELAASRERLGALRETLALKAKIRSYEEERKKLREGSPCPLCGAMHHPFAEDVPADLTDEDEAQLAVLERAMEKLASSLAGHGRDAVHVENGQREASSAAREQTQKLRSAVAALSPALSAALGRCEEGGENASSASGTAGNAAPSEEKTDLAPRPAEAWENDILSALTLTERAPALVPLLEKLHSRQAEELAEAENLLRMLDAQEQAGRRLAEDTERLRRMHEKAQADVQSAERESLRLGTEKAALEKDAAAKARKTAEDADALRRAVSGFGEKAESTEDLASAVHSLAQRRDRYAALLSREAEARDTLADQTRRLAVGAEALASARNEYAASSENRKKRARALEELEHSRRELFGERSVDEEEKAAGERLRAGEERAEKLRETLENASRVLARSRSDYASLAERLLQRSSDLKDMENALHEHLASERFTGEEECRAALLPRETMDQLAAERQALAERAAGLDARAAALAKKREQQRSPLPSREETERRLAETRAERETALRSLGSLQERLKANAERKSQAALLREKRERQAALCRRWAALNELIGSADGKKFRNYAQELTFRRLIIMANRQLAFMTDRYLLVHSKDEALTLNVIDRYQADAVRSSRNLSGGESFIVSLALALGLAQMASRNVRVDSVFLDEGFGTLDEESLGTALDMLSSLRQKGKMIGIISHVQAVRDRVSLQIRVSPRGNGQSSLSGPGVSRNDRSE